jgi:hypothetical protein
MKAVSEELGGRLLSGGGANGKRAPPPCTATAHLIAAPRKSATSWGLGPRRQATGETPAAGTEGDDHDSDASHIGGSVVVDAILTPVTRRCQAIPLSNLAFCWA